MRAETRLRMILGEYEDQEPYALDIFLSPVTFPMKVERAGDVGLEEIPEGETEDEAVLTNEAELREWAEARFANYKTYKIWSMPLPADAVRHE